MSHTAQLGGGEIALLRLIEGIDPSSFQVTVILFEDGPLVERLRRAGVGTEVIALGTLNDVTRTGATLVGSLQLATGALAFAPRLIRTLRRYRPDLLVANTLKAALFLSLVAPVVGSRWVWHLHDRLALDYLPARTAAVLRVIARHSPNHVVVNSLATRQTLGRIPFERTSVAYPGLERSAFTGRSVPPERVIGMLGRISETKGQREFVEAAATLLDRHPDTRFRIVGRALFQDGDYETSVRELVDSSPLAAHLEFAGWADDPSAEMKRLQILVHASPVAEPFGQVIIEAMAAGVPVIATAGGGVFEILDPEGQGHEITDGVRRSELGILVRPGDASALARAMVWALDHPEDVTAMAGRATTSAQLRFSIDEARSIVLAAWTSALRPPKRRPRAIR